MSIFRRFLRERSSNSSQNPELLASFRYGEIQGLVDNIMHIENEDFSLSNCLRRLNDVNDAGHLFPHCGNENRSEYDIVREAIINKEGNRITTLTTTRQLNSEMNVLQQLRTSGAINDNEFESFSEGIRNRAVVIARDHLNSETNTNTEAQNGNHPQGHPKRSGCRSFLLFCTAVTTLLFCAGYGCFSARRSSLKKTTINNRKQSEVRYYNKPLTQKTEDIQDESLSEVTEDVAETIEQDDTEPSEIIDEPSGYSEELVFSERYDELTEPVKRVLDEKAEWRTYLDEKTANYSPTEKMASERAMECVIKTLLRKSSENRKDQAILGSDVIGLRELMDDKEPTEWAGIVLSERMEEMGGTLREVKNSGPDTTYDQKEVVDYYVKAVKDKKEKLVREQQMKMNASGNGR